MTMTVDQLARSLVSVGYPDAEIRAALVRRFPGADVDQAIAAAQKWQQNIELDLTDAQERNDRAAREAEHKEEGA